VIEKLLTLWPEITLLIGATLTMILGVSPNLSTRRLCAPVAGLALLIAGALAYLLPVKGAGILPNLPVYGKIITAAIGLLLLLLMVGLPDRDYEARVVRGEKFDALRNTRGEFYAFFLFSLTGLMLCAGADDLIWLFLALELVSLPTYVMVAISTARNRSMEAAVKYFFLGALGAATFLYGFVFIYGATGTTYLPKIGEILHEQLASGGLSGIAAAGLVLAVLGICFKIAAVPMHFYTADVYQGAASPVTAFLAFVPKAAGFFALLLLLGTVGWASRDAASGLGLPQPLHAVLWIIAALTMTVGNVLAVLQSSVKRMFAYSSIAHSGYMLVGVIAGPVPAGSEAESLQASGLSAVMFYLLAYGVTNVAAFAVLAALQKHGKSGQSEEVDHVSDFKGLCGTNPILGWTLVLACVGLLGLPPLLGFFSKMPLLTSGMRAGEHALVIILVINSAIAAYYYLRLAATALLDTADLTTASQVRPLNVATRPIAGIIGGLAVVALSFWPVTVAANWAASYRPSGAAPATADPSLTGKATPIAADQDSATHAAESAIVLDGAK